MTARRKPDRHQLPIKPVSSYRLKQIRHAAGTAIGCALLAAFQNKTGESHQTHRADTTP